MAEHEPDYLDPAKVGATCVSCPGCARERWYGYGPCTHCGAFLPPDVRPAEPIPMPGLGYHVLAGEVLLELLRRCHAGEDPDAVFAEAWANADHERPS